MLSISRIIYNPMHRKKFQESTTDEIATCRHQVRGAPCSRAFFSLTPVALANLSTSQFNAQHHASLSNPLLALHISIRCLADRPGINASSSFSIGSPFFTLCGRYQIMKRVSSSASILSSPSWKSLATGGELGLYSSRGRAIATKYPEQMYASRRLIVSA